MENYIKEFDLVLNNVEINTKTMHIHNIKKEEMIFMYKNFFETNNLSELSFKDLEVDNLSFSLYEDWLVRFNDY